MKVKKALDNCIVSDEVIDQKLYTEFKAKIVSAKTAAVNLNPFFYLGLKEDCSEEELKMARKKFSLALHTDKNKATDANALFDCMNELAEICSKLIAN
jgi:DnaJ-class molecular chaperone